MDILAFRDSICSSDPLLYAAISQSIDVISRAFHIYPVRECVEGCVPELVFSFNGGKDSTVLLHLLRAALAECKIAGEKHPEWLNQSVPIVYFASEGEFPEVRDFMEECALAQGFRMQYLPSFKDGLNELISKGAKAILIGQRSTDPDGGALDFFTPTSVSWPAIMRICPILKWNYKLVWRFLRGTGVKYCSLYDEGYTSLGSVSNSIPNPLLRVKEPADASGRKYRPAYELNDDKYERLGRLLPGKTYEEVASMAAEDINVLASVAVVVVYPSKTDACSAMRSIFEQLSGLKLPGKTIDSIHCVREEDSSIGELLAKLSPTADVVLLLAYEPHERYYSLAHILCEAFNCSLKKTTHFGGVSDWPTWFSPTTTLPTSADSFVVMEDGTALSTQEATPKQCVAVDSGWWLRIRNVFVASRPLSVLAEQWRKNATPAAIVGSTATASHTTSSKVS